MAGVQIDGVNNKIDFDDDLDTSISANTDDTLVIEAGGNTMATITATTFTINDGTTITTADNTDTLTLVSTDTDAAAGPNLHLYRNQGTDEGDDDVLGQIKFSGRNDNAQDVLFYRQDVQSSDVSDGAEDGQVRHLIMINGSETEFLRMNPTGFIFNEGSADLDFRVESNSNTHMLFVDAGNNRVGINTNSPSQALHVVGDVQLTDAHPMISFTDSDDNSDSRIYHSAGNSLIDADNNNEVSGSYFRLSVDDTENLRAGGQKISTGGEDAPDVDAGGITLNQGGNDLNIMTFKSSDVAHGMTGNFETDTFAAFRKQSATLGGLAISAQSEGTEVLKFNISQTDGITTKSTSAMGAVIVGVSQKSGTGVNAVGTDDNLMVITNYINTQFIFDAEGTFHSNVGTATYDEYDDAHLVRAMDLSTSTKGLIASKFDEFIQYKHEDLADAKIVGRDEDGTPNSMVNWTAMSQLHNGAIWQQYEKHQKLAEAVYEMAKEALGEDKADAILKKHDIKLLN